MKYIFRRYTSPTNRDTAVIIVFFNFAHSVRIIQNLLYVKHILALANIPAYYAEIALTCTDFVLEPAENVYQVQTDSIMFYKENLIDVMVNRVPPEYTKLVAMDADIIFTDPNWYNVVSADLDKYDVIQPYSTAINLRHDFTYDLQRTPIVTNRKDGHPGFVWGFRREWIEANRLYPYSIIGGGDTVTAAYILGLSLPTSHVTNRQLYDNWMASRISAYKKPVVGVSQITILHLAHGSINNRQYVSRHQVIDRELRRLGISDVSTVIITRSDGILEWNEAVREKMNRLLLEYFVVRKDDGVTR
jgi:hypothetical protein